MPLATLLATPYAFDYDVAMVTGAVLAVIAARIEAGDRFYPLELPLLFAAVVIPAILPAHVGALVAIVPATFAVTLWSMSRKAGWPILLNRSVVRTRPADMPI